MKNIRLLTKYLQDTLGITVSIRPWAGSDRLPLLLQQKYGYYQCGILNQPYLLQLDKQPGGQTPAAIKKQMDIVAQHWTDGIIYVCPSMTAYNRKRFIQNKVPFVVPGNQMYLPLLGVDLREHFKQMHTALPGHLRPATQVVVLYVLTHKLYGQVTPLLLAAKLGYSLMTLSRSFKELENAGLVHIERLGRNHMLHFNITGVDLWDKALPYLASPVKKRLHMLASGTNVPGIPAGFTALSGLSMLVEPSGTEVAVTAAEWKQWAVRNEPEVLDIPEPGAVEIELWSYQPGIIAGDGSIDRLSLYLSLRDNDDERVAAALDEMMAAVEW